MRATLIGISLLLASLPLLLAHTATPAAAQTTPAHKPTLFLIGDSTVKNGQDNGALSQWGWGHLILYLFDKDKITVENDALGGTSSRTFMTSPNLWPRVLPKIEAGDYVIMQFGHNDGGNPATDTARYRATLKGSGDDTLEGIVQRGGTETVHSFGWYIRQYIAQTREKGATPIVCSLIPRNRWTNGKNNRNNTDYALWAEQAAKQGGALFIPLNDLVADTYDKMGQENVTAQLFPTGEQVHPNWAGAKLNAQLVVEGIRSLKDCPLKDYLVANPEFPPEPPPPQPRGRGRGAATGTLPATTTAPATTRNDQ